MREKSIEINLVKQGTETMVLLHRNNTRTTSDTWSLPRGVVNFDRKKHTVFDTKTRKKLEFVMDGQFESGFFVGVVRDLGKYQIDPAKELLVPFSQVNLIDDEDGKLVFNIWQGIKAL